MFESFSQKYKFAYILFSSTDKLEAIVTFKRRRNWLTKKFLSESVVKYKGNPNYWKTYPGGKEIGEAPKAALNLFWELLQEKVRTERRPVMGVAEKEFEEELNEATKELGINAKSDGF